MTEFPTEEEMEDMSQSELRAMSLNLTMQVIDSDEHNRFIDHIGGIGEMRKSAADFIARLMVMTMVQLNYLEAHLDESECCGEFKQMKAAAKEMIIEAVMVGMLLDPANFTTKLHEGLDVLDRLRN